MSKSKKGYDMQQNTWFLLCAGGIVGGIILFSRLYRWWMKSKRITTSAVVGWQTPPQPEPETAGFQTFYILLLQHGRYTRGRAKRLYDLDMYQTAAKEEAPVQPELLDAYDTEVEAELILEELLRRRKEQRMDN